jgi:hypothetical protein
MAEEVSEAVVDAAVRDLLSSALSRSSSLLSDVAALAHLCETVCENVPEEAQHELQRLARECVDAAKIIADAQSQAKDVCISLGTLGSLSAPLSQELKELSQRVQAGEFPTPLSSAASTPARRQLSGRLKGGSRPAATAMDGEAPASLNTLGELDEEDEEDEEGEDEHEAEEGGLAPLPQNPPQSRVRKDSGTRGGPKGGAFSLGYTSLANRPPPQVLEEMEEEDETAVPRPTSMKPTFQNPPPFTGLAYLDDEEEEEEDGTGAGGGVYGAPVVGLENEDEDEDDKGTEPEDVYDNMQGLARRASKAAARVPLHDSDSEDEDGDAAVNLTTMSSLGNTTVLPPLDPEVQGVTDIIMNDLEALFAAVEEWRPNDIVCVTTGVVRSGGKGWNAVMYQLAGSGRELRRPRSDITHKDKTQGI